MVNTVRTFLRSASAACAPANSLSSSLPRSLRPSSSGSRIPDSRLRALSRSFPSVPELSCSASSISDAARTPDVCSAMALRTLVCSSRRWRTIASARFVPFSFSMPCERRLSDMVSLSSSPIVAICFSSSASVQVAIALRARTLSSDLLANTSIVARLRMKDSESSPACRSLDAYIPANMRMCRLAASARSPDSLLPLFLPDATLAARLDSPMSLGTSSTLPGVRTRTAVPAATVGSRLAGGTGTGAASCLRSAFPSTSAAFRSYDSRPSSSFAMLSKGCDASSHTDFSSAALFSGGNLSNLAFSAAGSRFLDW